MQLRVLLTRLDGPGYHNEADRDAAVAELRTMGEALHPALAAIGQNPDWHTRCLAGVAAMLARLDGWQAVVLHLLDDPESSVRWYGCGLLYDAGDEQAVPALVARLQSDADPGVRVLAANALGRIGCSSATSALADTAEHDYEVDPLGFTPAGAARKALEGIRAGGNAAPPAASPDRESR